MRLMNSIRAPNPVGNPSFEQASQALEMPANLRYHQVGSIQDLTHTQTSHMHGSADHRIKSHCCTPCITAGHIIPAPQQYQSNIDTGMVGAVGFGL